tara:strand:+ start:301 stop:438 length:138 start_codon:yes stop_codon:yes gene_type:complete
LNQVAAAERLLTKAAGKKNVVESFWALRAIAAKAIPADRTSFFID